MPKGTRIEVAGLRRRAVALLVDAVSASALSLGVVLLFHAAGVARSGAAVNNVVAALAAPVYFIPQYALGRTIGMRVLGLELVRQASGVRPGLVRAALRLLLSVGDLALVMLPVLYMAPGDPQKRAPHDRLSGTVVIRKRNGRGRFWEGEWGQWLAQHHDQRPWSVRHAEAMIGPIAFVAGSNRRLAGTLGVIAILYGTPLAVGLLDQRASMRAERIGFGLASVAIISGGLLFLRYRLRHPMFVKASPGDHRLAGRLLMPLSGVATAVTVLSAVRGWWVAFGAAIYVALLGALFGYSSMRTAQILSDQSRHLPLDVAEKLQAFPGMSPLSRARRVTLVLANGRHVQRVVVGYGDVVMHVGIGWRMTLDFAPTDVVDAIDEGRAGAATTAARPVGNR
jgi:hypothetical protein